MSSTGKRLQDISSQKTNGKKGNRHKSGITTQIKSKKRDPNTQQDTNVQGGPRKNKERKITHNQHPNEEGTLLQTHNMEHTGKKEDQKGEEIGRKKNYRNHKPQVWAVIDQANII